MYFDHPEPIKRLPGVINDILDLSKVEAGKMQIEPIRCSPFELLAEVVSLMRVRADAKQLKLETDVAGLLPETVLADPLRLRQVLVNLVGNAVKFTDQGEVRITARLIGDGDLPRLRFDVTDTGIGMNEEQIGRLFQAFSQAGAEVTVVENGKQAMELALVASPGPGRRIGDPAEPFDVILMDMQMPVIDGYEATRELRARGCTVPIIALTAHVMAEDRQKCLDAGCLNRLASVALDKKEGQATFSGQNKVACPSFLPKGLPKDLEGPICWPGFEPGDP